MDLKGRYRPRDRGQKTAEGFSMVEVLIAGILLASSATAVARISVAALTSSSKVSERARIEAAINDNIQTMQKEDSYFTKEWIDDNFTCAWIDKALGNLSPGSNDEELPTYDAYCTTGTNMTHACINPPQALHIYLETEVPKPRVEGIKRSLDSTSIPGILKVTYSFEGPEQQIKAEQRLIEMSPNFAAQCYTTK